MLVDVKIAVTERVTHRGRDMLVDVKIAVTERVTHRGG